MLSKMDNQNLKTPNQWEQYYCEYLQNDINVHSNFTNSIMNQMDLSRNYSPEANFNLLQEFKKHRNHLNEYNHIDKWCKDLGLIKFSNLLNSCKLEMDKTINIQTQTYQNSIAARQNELQIFKKHDSDMIEIYKKLNADRQSAFKATNDAWNRYFNI
jgi:hypothetical protein